MRNIYSFICLEIKTRGHALSSLFPCMLLAAILLSCTGRENIATLVTLTIGDVKVKSEGGSFQPAKLQLELKKNDVVATGEKSFVTIQLGTEGLIQIGANSTVAMQSLLNEKTRTIFLEKGKVLSRIEKLKKGHDYMVRTPTTIAAVRGTQFSVSYDGRECSVALAKGMVAVTHIRSGKAESIEAGKAADVTDAIRIRAITNVESKELELVQAVGINPSAAENAAELEMKEKEQIPEIERIEKEIEALGGSHMSIGQLRAKYGRIDEVTDYRGKTYAGVILTRGAQYKMLTPQGIVNIPSNTVKQTRTR